MFERLTIRRQNIWGQGAPIDIGMLAESLLFYETTHVLADYATIQHLIDTVGPHLLLDLMDRGDLSISYSDELLAIHTSGGVRHEPILFTAEKFKIDVAVPSLIRKATGHSKGSLVTQRMLKSVRDFKYAPDLTAAMRAEARVKEWAEAAVAQLLGEYAPDYVLPRPLVFEVNEDLTVSTNIDFDAINPRESLRSSNQPDKLTPAMLLAQLAEATSSLRLAADLGSELALAPTISRLVQQRVAGVLNKSQRSTEQIGSFFDEVTLEGPGAVRDAINSGARSFSELVDLIRRAGTFKTWLDGVPANSDLAVAYYRELSKNRWFDSLGVRAIRYIVLMGLGLATGALPALSALAANAVLSAADAFWLDKLLGGWTPNQFVDGELAKFVGQDPGVKARAKNRGKAERRRRRGK